jgi:hypothetical protein
MSNVELRGAEAGAWIVKCIASCVLRIAGSGERIGVRGRNRLQDTFEEQCPQLD